MRSQQLIELSIHILFMLLITIGVLTLLFNISDEVDMTTSTKKANLILNKLEYNTLSLCYYSKKYNSSVNENLIMPKAINGHQYEIVGNGTSVKLISNGLIISRDLNVTGNYYSGRPVKIVCDKNSARISN